MFRALVLLGLALAAAGCGSARTPEQLSGLWSAGPAACEAGVGVRFGAGAIEAVYDRRTEVLFAHPRYELQHGQAETRIRITYDLPRVAGGVRIAGAHGVLVLSRRADGGIAPVSHHLVDGRTGAVRVRMQDDPAQDLLTLQPCGPSPWRERLRGRLTT